MNDITVIWMAIIVLAFIVGFFVGSVVMGWKSIRIIDDLRQQLAQAGNDCDTYKKLLEMMTDYANRNNEKKK